MTPLAAALAAVPEWAETALALVLLTAMVAPWVWATVA